MAGARHSYFRNNKFIKSQVTNNSYQVRKNDYQVNNYPGTPPVTNSHAIYARCLLAMAVKYLPSTSTYMPGIICMKYIFMLPDRPIPIDEILIKVRRKHCG